MTSPVPALSVVVPAYNSRDLLRESLRAFASQEVAEPFEIVVVDDGSSDGTGEMVAALQAEKPFAEGRPGLRLVRTANRGRSGARNLGAGEARAPVLLFMDADVRPTPGLLAAHLRHHAGGGRVGVQGRTLQHPSTLVTPFMRAPYLLPDLTVRRRRRLSPLHVVTRNFSVSADAFRQVGGFDEAFTGYGWEDIELGLRLARAGTALHYEPDAVAYHYHIQTLDDVLPKLRQAGAGAVYFWRKHGRPLWLGLFLEIHPALLPLKWLIFRTELVTRLVRRLLPWAERRELLALCNECYTHLLWKAYYAGVWEAMAAERTRPRHAEEART